jgi:hypothetical protein
MQVLAQLAGVLKQIGVSVQQLGCHQMALALVLLRHG